MAITAHYASMVLVLLLVLTVRVILARRAARVGLGDGGNPDLQRRIRAHANLVEYAPIVLIAMALCESLNAAAIGVHAIGLLLVSGRLLHAYGVSQNKETFVFRTLGMCLTLAAIGLAAALCFLESMG